MHIARSNEFVSSFFMGPELLLDPEALLSPASFITTIYLISDLGLVKDTIKESIPVPR